MSQVVIDAKGTKVAVDSSKWTISGNNIFNKNSGNIGIGTSAPTAQLHTTGTVRFAGLGTNTVDTKVLTADNSGNVTTRTVAGLLSGNALTSLNGLTGSVQTFATGTTGTDFNISSSANVHTFNLPVASATNSGKLSAANWTTFNNKIGTVTATTAAAVTTASTTATINNTAAYWNANQLQGKAVSSTAPVSGQVLSWNGTNWAPTNAAPAVTTNTISSTANTITSTVNGVAASTSAVNSVSNTSGANSLSTTVNGITSTPVNIINTNILTQNGNNQLVSTLNGMSSVALTVNVAGDVTGDLGASVVSKINGSPLGTTTGATNGQVLGWNGTNWTPSNAAPATTTHTLSSAGNTITSTVNGVAATAPAVNTVSNVSYVNALFTSVNGITSPSVNIINLNTLSQNGSNQLISTVNGVATTALTANISGDVTGNLGSSVVSKINGAPLGTTTGATNGQVLSWNGTNWAPSNAAPATTTHTFSSAANTLTSTVNGVTVTAPSVNSITNTSNSNSLSTTVNGITSAPVNIINSNSLTVNAGSLTSAVNGISSGAVNILSTAGNGLTASAGNVELGGTLSKATIINTGSTNTLSLGGLQTGSSSDSLLVVAASGVVKMVAQPASFPQLLVDARRTTAYSPGTSYATLVYNTINVNAGSVYNTSTGVFTAPATGLYEIILNNGYNWGAANSQIVNQILVNNAVDVEKSISSYPTVTTTNTTISGSTIVSITSGQTVKITAGGEIGTVTPLVGTGQHVMKIIRLQ